MKLLSIYMTMTFLMSLGTAYAESIPGFLEIEPYAVNSAPMNHANYSNDEWRVELVNDKLSVSKSVPNNKIELDIAGGKLIAEDGGEWGGKLEFRKGSDVQKIHVDHGVSSLFKLSEDRVAAMTGISHMGLNRGALLIFSKKAKAGKWKLERKITLSDAPMTSFRKDSKTILFASSKGLHQVECDSL
ncbi:hypothetical protein D3C72_1200640 [compost metagenome]